MDNSYVVTEITIVIKFLMIYNSVKTNINNNFNSSLVNIIASEMA